MSVWLVYEDDYGSTFSPYFLTKVFHDEAEARAYVGVDNWLCRLREHQDLGDDLSSYPQSVGGLFGS